MSRPHVLTATAAAKVTEALVPGAPRPDGWVSAGLAQAIEYLAASGVPFTADALRDDRFGLDVQPNEVGPAFARARRAGIVRHVGYRTSTAPSRHGGVLRVWVGVISEGAS